MRLVTGRLCGKLICVPSVVVAPRKTRASVLSPPKSSAHPARGELRVTLTESGFAPDRDGGAIAPGLWMIAAPGWPQMLLQEKRFWFWIAGPERTWIPAPPLCGISLSRITENAAPSMAIPSLLLPAPGVRDPTSLERTSAASAPGPR